MSIIDKLKRAHPAYWVLGLGGVALAIDYYVERDKSVASSIYRKLSGSAASGGGDSKGRASSYGRVAPMPGAAVMLPGALYQTSQVYYPAFPSVHPYRHWMRRGPIFDHGFERSLGHDRFGREYEHEFGGHGREHGYGREYGAFGRNHVR